MPIVNDDELQNLTPENVQLVVVGSQKTIPNPQFATIALQPPPVVLVHGIWSSAAEAWSAFTPWLQSRYTNNDLIFAADYGKFSSLSFDDQDTQKVFALAVSNALNSAAAENTVATRVDVIGHSMGGLVTEYFMNNQGGPFGSTYFPKNVVHKLVTVGTPFLGSALASALWDNRAKPLPANSKGLDHYYCSWYAISPCTLEGIFAKQGKTIDTGVQSLEGSYTSHQPFWGIEGQRPSISPTWGLLTALIGGFLPDQTVDTVLGTSNNDTIVTADSQTYGAVASHKSVIPGIVHTTFAGTDLYGYGDVGETSSPAVWNQALYWLMGGTGQYLGTPAHDTNLSDDKHVAGSATPPSPVFDLTGYTEIPASNISISPAPESSLVIGVAAAITATSPTKQLSELLLFQAASNPADVSTYYATQTPFTVSFVPTRLGSANFTAVGVFSDKTFAAVPLSYKLEPSGSPTNLMLRPPATALPIGATVTINLQAAFPNGDVDVTSAAKFQTRSGGAKVFAVGSGGSITATGNGVDWLDASYDGLMASVPITVGGACTYSLTPNQRLLSYVGGSITIKVTANDGCSWTADAGGSTWLELSTASGTGNGSITAKAEGNKTGSLQESSINVAGQSALIYQPDVACSYLVDSGPISLPATGGGGIIYVSSVCPLLGSSSADWLLTDVFPGLVYYNALPNSSPSKRSATLTLGNKALVVTEEGN